MAKGYILYNPIAGNGTVQESVKILNDKLPAPIEYYDMTQIDNYESFLREMNHDDYLVICGGDGTLNRFINNTATLEIPQDILYFPMGSGNDFARELSTQPIETPVSIKRYLQNLPSVEVKGKTYYFLNGIGFGIDGYCCEVGDQLRAIPGKNVDYTGIAIKGLLFKFDARNAKVTVDGNEYSYKKVWIAPTMHGKYYGGGMIPTPGQNRLNTDGTLSVMLFHGAGRLHTLCVFPSIFKGKHVKHKKMVAVHTGHKITVEFDRPTPLQIDGETILDVTSYTATSSKVNATSKLVTV